jgi:uncharacterized protein (TIGR03000 family)
MHRLRLALVMVAMLSSKAALAGDTDPHIKMILERAVNAAGGARKIAELKNVTWKATFVSPEGDIIKVDISGQGWDRVRAEIEFQMKGKEPSDVTLIMNGDKAWMRLFDWDVWDWSKPAANQFALRDLYFALRAPEMLPALLDKQFRLVYLGEAKVKGHPAVGIRIHRKDRPDVSLFFDQKTGLPVKAELRIPNPDGKQDTGEIFFSDYKDFHGLKHFTKAIGAGELTGEPPTRNMILEISDIRPQKQLDASLFQRPEKSRPVVVTIRVPSPDAEVWFDGQRTRQEGAQRLFESPALHPGKYSYQIRAKWRQNGKNMEETRTVQVQPGDRVTVDFTSPEQKRDRNPSSGR